MDLSLFSTNEPVIFTSGESLEEDTGYMTDEEIIKAAEIADNETSISIENKEEEIEADQEIVVQPGETLTNEIYMEGINDLINVIDSESVHGDIIYVDRGTLYNIDSDLPDYAVVYECNGNQVIFPTDYAENLIVSDGMLINLGSSYTAGLQIDGYSVSNYLSSEITIPTYHSSTWYQYMQSYGQPYRIVDRYVSNYGSITSSTRSSVNVEWTGGNPWEGFTFDRAAMFIVIVVLLIMLVFRKGNK